MKSATLPTQEIDKEKLKVKVSPRTLFGGFDSRVNWKRVFCACFQSIPSFKSFNGIDGKKLSRWIDTEQKEKILKKHSYQRYKKGRRASIFEENVAYILTERIIIYIEMEDQYVEVSFDSSHEVEFMVTAIRKFAKRISGAADINMVINGREGLELKQLKGKKVPMKLNENYNDDLILLHKGLIKKIKSRKIGGLILFHGVPGTGKSTYIRHLINFLKKEIIFISPRIAGNLDDPDFTKLLISHPNSVIIIEDAEELLVSRNNEKNSGISTLLNLTDGLLGMSLGIQFICTFNTAINKIDKALLRKGRLLAMHEFGELSIEKSRKLLESLGAKDFMVTQPMTLAEIYNVQETQFEFEPKRNKIGFAVEAA